MSSADTEEFVRIFVKNQGRILRFIQCLIPNFPESEDVLQETSVVLWKKWPEYQRDRDFVKWACGIARLEVFRALRQNKRSGQYLDEAILNQVAAAALAEATDARRMAAGESALKQCVERLVEGDKSIVRLRYREQKTIEQIAAECKMPKSSVHDHLGRIRARLLRCVRKRLES